MFYLRATASAISKMDTVLDFEMVKKFKNTSIFKYFRLWMWTVPYQRITRMGAEVFPFVSGRMTEKLLSRRISPRAGKMKRILCSDWLPERARWAYLARSGLRALFPQKRTFLVILY